MIQALITGQQWLSCRSRARSFPHAGNDTDTALHLPTSFRHLITITKGRHTLEPIYFFASDPLVYVGSRSRFLQFATCAIWLWCKECEIPWMHHVNMRKSIRNIGFYLFFPHSCCLLYSYFPFWEMWDLLCPPQWNHGIPVHHEM